MLVREDELSGVPGTVLFDTESDMVTVTEHEQEGTYESVAGSNWKRIGDLLPPTPELRHRFEALMLKAANTVSDRRALGTFHDHVAGVDQ